MNGNEVSAQPLSKFVKVRIYTQPTYPSGNEKPFTNCEFGLLIEQQCIFSLNLWASALPVL